MEQISAWILSIAGAALVGVLVDIILPEGQMQKYCRSIYALIMLLIIITPIPKLLKLEANISDLWSKGGAGDIILDTEYIESIYKSRIELLEQSAENHLEDEGFKNVELKIYVNEYTTRMKIMSVIVDSKNLVISEKNQHINYYEAIVDRLAVFLGIERGIIIGSGSS